MRPGGAPTAASRGATWRSEITQQSREAGVGVVGCRDRASVLETRPVVKKKRPMGSGREKTVLTSFD